MAVEAVQGNEQEAGEKFKLIQEKVQPDPAPEENSDVAALEELRVTLKDPVLVYPKETTPSVRQKLYLSPLDKLPPLFIYSLYFYENNGFGDTSEVFNKLKDALEKNLVAYYPAAGRIVYNAETGEPELHCLDQGVMLVEASTNARISDFGDMREADKEFEKFICRIVPSPETPLVVSQITRCACGGFVIGFGSRHELFDGLSALEFLSDWASLARGVAQASIPPPCHQRELLRPKLLHAEEDFSEDMYLERFQGIPLLDVSKFFSSTKNRVLKALSISEEMIKTLKHQAMEGGLLSSCTTFEVLTAQAWRARIKALGLKPSERALLEFTVNSRLKALPPLPPKLIGNGFIMAHSNQSVEEILAAPFHSLVKIVQDAKASVTDTFIWKFINAKGTTKLKGVPSFRETTIVTDWTRFSFHQLNFGWGAAAFATPVAMILPDVLFFLRDGLDNGRICLKLGLEPELVDAFKHHFYSV